MKRAMLNGLERYSMPYWLDESTSQVPLPPVGKFLIIIKFRIILKKKKLFQSFEAKVMP